MTGSKGHSEFCFPSTLNVLLGFTLGNIEDSGEIKLTEFHLGPVINNALNWQSGLLIVCCL